MVSTIENTLFETSQPTSTADTTAINEQNLSPAEHIKYDTKRQLTVLLEQLHEYSPSLSPEQTLAQYGNQIESLTFRLGAQLVLKEPTERGAAESLHPPTVADVVFFFRCRDAAVDMMRIRESLDPQDLEMIEKNILLLDKLVEQAVDEVETDDKQALVAMNQALDLAIERHQGIKASYDEIRAGKSVKMTLNELLEASEDSETVTYDTFFPYRYAKELLEHTDDDTDHQSLYARDITLEMALAKAQSIASENPEVADSVLGSLSATTTERDTQKALEIASLINAPNSRAISLSNVLRARREQLSQEQIDEVEQEIMQLLDIIVENTDAISRRAFDMTEIAANLGDETVIQRVKHDILIYTQGSKDMAFTLNVPVQALFAAISTTDSTTSFQEAYRVQMVPEHNKDDAERDEHQEYIQARLDKLAMREKRRQLPFYRRLGYSILAR